MLRKLVFAATLALGMGGGLVAAENAQAAPVQPTVNSSIMQTIQHSAPAATDVYWRRGPGWGHRRGWGRPGWHRRCGWRRVRTRYGWASRRVCW